jgi:hypothetical protein
MHFVVKYQRKDGSIRAFRNPRHELQKDAIEQAKAAYDAVSGGISRAWVEDDEGTYVCDVIPDGSAIRRDP